MIISKDTQNVINFLNEFSSNSLRKSNDLASIIELSARELDPDLLFKIIFTGASLFNLWKIFQSAKLPESQGQTINEIKKSFFELRQHLGQLIENSDKDIQDRFNQIYFSDNDGADRNLIDLAHDLNSLKQLQISAKAQIK